MQLLIDIYKRGRNINPLFYGKAKTVGLPVIVVRILPEDYNLHFM